MRAILAIGILATMAVFAGCGGMNGPTVPPTTSVAPTTVPPATVQPVSGEDVFKAKCAVSTCHPASDTTVGETVGKINGFPYSGHGTWIDALEGMKNSFGVQLTAEEYNAVKKYLVDTYGVPPT